MIDLDSTRPPTVAPRPPPARAPGQPPRPGARARFVTAVATILCAGVIAYYISPLWQRLDTWGGTFDWGYFFFMAEVDRKTVVEFGQFPLWNPYYCGGSVHLANPQTYFLSPTFLFIWAFGTPIGLRLMITAAIVMAADGMRRFLGSLGVGSVGALVGGTGYAVSGAIAQHLGGGHVAWLGFCVLPYVLHSFNRAFSGQRRHILYGGLFLAWIFGHFGGYSYPYAALTLGVWGIFWSASAGRLGRGIATVVWMVGLSLGLCAVRLLPILEFMRGHPHILPDVDIVSPLEFGEIYAAHHRARGAAGHPYVWPEYGNYLGIAAVALMAVGIWTVVWRKKALRPLLTSMLVFVAFQIGNVPGFPWWLVKHLPIFHFMRAPSRFTTVVGLFACALAGLAVDRLQDPLAHARAASGRDGADAREGAGAGARAREGWLGTLVIALLALVFLIDAARFNREQWLQTLTTPP
ncbi:MAG TPA: hypothetical protein VKO16_04960, partial [Polyangia bacterium]|nr:hypothetical protein [Polyangia bacterium]